MLVSSTDDICETEPVIKQKDSKKLFVPSLTVPGLAVALSNTILILLLLEIASTFQVNEGVAAQLRTANAFGEVVFAVFVGVLAVRFRHKSLLLIGLSLISVSAIGTFLAPTFYLVLLSSFMAGIGAVIVTVMAFTLIGDVLPSNRKAKAVRGVVAAGFISTLVGTPVISLIAGAEGWRYAFLLLVFPVSVAGLVLVSVSIPFSNLSTKQPPLEKKIYAEKFKQILLNRSAASCLIARLFFSGGSALFSVAFFRLHFALSMDYIVYITLIDASILIIGSLVTGRLAHKFGTKPLTIIGLFGNGVLIIMMFFPNLWVGLVFNFLNAWFVAMAVSAYPSLVLDQVPHSRGTMMSLMRVFNSIGSAITPAVGGALLVLFSAQSGNSDTKSWDSPLAL